MSLQGAVIGLLVLAVVLANALWLGRSPQLFWKRCLYGTLLYGTLLCIGWALEYKMTGTVHTQGWPFYVLTACLFVVSGLPAYLLSRQRFFV